MNNLMMKGRTATAKAAALYASYEAARKTARMVAERIGHTLQIDCDYSEGLYHAAVKLAGEAQTRMPTARKSTYAHHDQKGFRSTEWAWVPVPGVSLMLQVRSTGYEEITFRAPRLSELAALRKRLEEMAAEMDEDDGIEFDPVDFTPTTNIIAWGKEGWQQRMNRNSRSFKSVLLPAELQSEIEADLQRFTESKARLNRLEMPWRRGYLLSGPPGTGKTSMSLAIAGSLGFNLAVLSLTDIKSDGDLRQAVSQLRGRTVLVIEDIDAYSVSHDRDHNTARDGALSLSGLLNSLDGFETPDGLVTIATTNHVEHLDAALVRSGRLDRTFHLGYIEARELERLFAWFYEMPAPEDAPVGTGNAKLAPAEVAELFKQHLEDPEGGWAAVLAKIESTQGGRHLEVAA